MTPQTWRIVSSNSLENSSIKFGILKGKDLKAFSKLEESLHEERTKHHKSF